MVRGCLAWCGVKLPRVAAFIPQALRSYSHPTKSNLHKPTKTLLYFDIRSKSMDTEALAQYLADDPPTIVPLAIKPHFDALTEKEKLYAHHISM